MGGYGQVIKPTIRRANRLFFWVLVLGLLVAVPMQLHNLYLGITINELAVILGLTIVFLLRDRLPVRPTLRLRLVSGQTLLLGFVAGLLGWWIATFLANAVALYYTRIGVLPPQPFPSITNGRQLAEALVVLGLLPGFCEETMFRGYILRAYQRLGAGRAILASAFLFALMHLSLQNLLANLFLGLLLGCLVYFSDSLIPGIVSHVTNNALALTVSYLGQIYQPALAASAQVEPGAVLILGVGAALAIIPLYLVVLRLRTQLRRPSAEIGLPPPAQEDCQEREGGLWESLSEWPIAVALVVFLVMAGVELATVLGLLG